MQAGGEQIINFDYEDPITSLIKSRLSKLLLKLAKIFAFIGLFLLFISYAPSLWYQISPGKLNLSDLILQTAKKIKKEEVQAPVAKEIYLPRFDPKLSQKNMLKIPSLRIETEIHEAALDNYEEALRKGVWRIADFGMPDTRSQPVILTAHRFGYFKWSIPYRLKNSFFSLPRLKVGETVEIVWEQRKYVYEVYAEGKGEEITDYTADLILYTCESLNTQVRIFKYARLLEI